MRLLALALASLTACYSQADHSADYDEAWCEQYLACTDPAILEFAPYDDVKSCVEYRAEAFEEDTGCDFDRGAARDCVKGLSQQTCEDFNAGSRVEACEEVCAAED